MIRHPPRSTLSSSSAASDVYKRQVLDGLLLHGLNMERNHVERLHAIFRIIDADHSGEVELQELLPYFQKLRPKMKSRAKQEQLCRRLDTDGSGAVSVQQFVEYFRCKLGPDKKLDFIEASLDHMEKLARRLLVQRDGVALPGGSVGVDTTGDGRLDRIMSSSGAEHAVADSLAEFSSLRESCIDLSDPDHAILPLPPGIHARICERHVEERIWCFSNGCLLYTSPSPRDS
eukprot:TRINITY_DN36385_c0_g1_i2.p1 TRINITY_DN36385_c0_g1~~TRINITY_DN36385_c0_g1_i2.p1  ORF type:complete len:231 (-),score=61.64 TRINITY_DN36385_c0_g1_i2:76-768(-)